MPLQLDIFKPDQIQVSPWTLLIPTQSKDDDWRHSEAHRKLFGIELSKGLDPFKAACNVFEDTSKALWASTNWLNDPLVLSLSSCEQEEKLLDKNALAVKLLQFAEEKNFEGTRYVVDAKERLAALRLYAEVQGFIGKIDINAITNNNLTNNVMKIVLVKPEPKPSLTIDNDNINEDIGQPSIVNNPLKIKLVAAR